MTIARDIGFSAPRRGNAILWALGAAAVIGVAALVFAGTDYALTAASLILLNCALAQCWNLAAGYAGQFSIGHTVFFGIGGYASTILFTTIGLSPWLGMLAGGLLAALAGAGLSAIAFHCRVKGVFFAVVTLSAAEVVRSLFDNWDFIGGSAGVYLILADAPGNMLFMSRLPYFLIILGFVLLLALGTSVMARSRFGQYLLAVREDEDAAEASGVPTFRVKVAVIALSAFLTALAGTFYAQFLLFIVPETLFSFEHVLAMLLGTIVGGAGTVSGPIIGSILFGLLSELMRSLPFADSREVTSGLRILYAIVLIVTVIRLPGGLVSLLPSSRRS